MWRAGLWLRAGSTQAGPSLGDERPSTQGLHARTGSLAADVNAVPGGRRGSKAALLDPGGLPGSVRHVAFADAAHASHALLHGQGGESSTLLSNVNMGCAC